MVSAELSKKDLRRFEKALRMLVESSEKDTKDVMRQQGRLFAVDMSRVTERRGMSKASGEKQQDDIEKTIKAIYMHPDRAAKLVSKSIGRKKGEMFGRWVKGGKSAKAQQMIDRAGIGSEYFRGSKITVGRFDGGRLHKKYRFKRFRAEIMVVENVSARNAYIKKEKAQAGTAKDGWAWAAKDLGGAKEIPLYAKKGHPRSGRGKVAGKKSKLILVVRNSVRYINETLTVADRNDVWKDRIKKMQKQVVETIKANQRKAKRKNGL